MHCGFVLLTLGLQIAESRSNAYTFGSKVEIIYILGALGPCGNLIQKPLAPSRVLSSKPVSPLCPRVSQSGPYMTSSVTAAPILKAFFRTQQPDAKVVQAMPAAWLRTSECFNRPSAGTVQFVPLASASHSQDGANQQMASRREWEVDQQQP